MLNRQHRPRPLKVITPAGAVTLTFIYLYPTPMNIYLCPSPELYPLYHREDATVIIVDIFRASTTMVTALASGARCIIPVASTEEAQTLGEQRGALIAAERNVVRCDFAQLGNDPEEYQPELVSGQEIVFTTTNGTRALTIAREHGAREILVGALTNLRATYDYLRATGRDVVVLAAGWQGQTSLEDSLYAGALTQLAVQGRAGRAANDMAQMAYDLWRTHCQSLAERMAYIAYAEHYQRLVKAGFESAVRYCLTLDSFSLVLRLQGEAIRSIP